MLILGIDTSCDDTSAAILEDGEVLSSSVNSQVGLHSPYSGVVPELASREHLKNILPVLEDALKKAGVGVEEVSAMAVTNGPGLMGSLLVGIYVTKALSLSLSRPLIPVNHLEGHLLSILLEGERPSFPYLALTVSGGHTSLYLVREPLVYHLLGNTLDDAAGEAFDKVAKLFGLGYPGGRVIEELAKKGHKGKLSLPRAYLSKDSLDFSFSGIKTAVAGFYRKWCSDPALRQEIRIEDVAAEFQEAMADMLSAKLFLAQRMTGVKDLVMAGGVACNSLIRDRLRADAKDLGLNIYFPRPAYCTDNAAMIALVGYYRYLKGDFGDLGLDAFPRVPTQT